MKKLLFSLLLATLLWFLMFSPWTADYFNFWYAMTASALLLTGVALLFGGHLLRTAFVLSVRRKAFWRSLATELGLGVTIAVALWGVFWVGDKVSQLLFAFARPQVELIYDMKSGFSPLMLSLLLLFVIGPAEDLFWRGYVQQRITSFLQTRAPSPFATACPPRFMAFLFTTCVYALVHVPSLNFMLVMAAGVCGVAWGGLYCLMPRHLPAIVLSHALWDAAAFVWFPL